MQIAQRRPAQTYNQTPNSGNYHTVDRFSYRRQGDTGVTAVALSQQTTGLNWTSTFSKICSNWFR